MEADADGLLAPTDLPMLPGRRRRRGTRQAIIEPRDLDSVEHIALEQRARSWNVGLVIPAAMHREASRLGGARVSARFGESFAIAGWR